MNPFTLVARWVVRRRKLARLQSALRTLPELERRIYMLSAGGRHSQGEVARQLGLSIEEVQEQLADALVALAAILDGTTVPGVAPDDRDG